jgi:hypothetical protein
MPETADLEPHVARRMERLLALGFKPVHAEDLATVPDVAHRAADLIAKGCSHQVAWLILRD